MPAEVSTLLYYCAFSAIRSDYPVRCGACDEGLYYTCPESDPAAIARSIFHTCDYASSVGPSPYQKPILINLSDPVQWNGELLSHIAFELEKEQGSIFKMNLGEGNTDDLLFDMIQYTDLEGRLAELPVPADSV